MEQARQTDLLPCKDWKAWWRELGVEMVFIRPLKEPVIGGVVESVREKVMQVKLNHVHRPHWPVFITFRVSNHYT